MSEINTQIHSWFDQDAIKTAVLGDEDYFLPSVTFREHHDRLLVISQLGIWAKLHKSHDHAKHEILQAIREACRRQDLRTAIDIVWSALIAQDECDDPLIVDFNLAQKDICSLLAKQKSTLKDDTEFEKILTAVETRLGIGFSSS